MNQPTPQPQPIPSPVQPTQSLVSQSGTGPTVAEKPSPQRTPTSMVLFLLLAFPPAAWVLMWRDHRYHHWFGKLLIISGLIALVITASSFAAIGTGVDRLYASLGVENVNQGLINMTNYLGIGFALLQVFFGIYLQHVSKKRTTLNGLELTVTILLLAASLYVAFLPLFLIVRDLYPALEALYQGNYS